MNKITKKLLKSAKEKTTNELIEHITHMDYYFEFTGDVDGIYELNNDDNWKELIKRFTQQPTINSEEVRELLRKITISHEMQAYQINYYVGKEHEDYMRCINPEWENELNKLRQAFSQLEEENKRLKSCLESEERPFVKCVTKLKRYESVIDKWRNNEISYATLGLELLIIKESE